MVAVLTVPAVPAVPFLFVMTSTMLQMVYWIYIQVKCKTQFLP